jgi:flagellar biosynthesis protein FliQ
VTPEDIVGAARGMMMLALMLVTPFLAGAVLASLLVGLFQAATRMNDLTLSFVPRFLAVLLVLYVAASWAGTRMTASIQRAAVVAGDLRE